MKVLSLLQPWASLVVLGHKKIETRSWNTKYRGELLIHASMGKKKEAIQLFNDSKKSFLYNSKLRGVAFNDLPFGAIIGKVNLVDTAPTSHFLSLFGDNPKMGLSAQLNGEQEKAFGDYSPGRFGWLLSDPVVFEKPIRSRGQLGIWNFDLEFHNQYFK